jgi:hypothetical protein
MAIAVFGTWMIIGLMLDGWAHNTSKPETFFSPWHGILYSGFGAAVIWFTWDGRRRDRAETPGDRLMTVGIILFAVGAAGDGVWHQIFGIEVNLEALLSPTHLLLLIGGFLMVTTPVRLAWHDLDADPSPTFAAFLPQVITLTLATALVLFFTQYLSAFEGIAFERGELRQVEGLASVLATNLILMFPVIHVLRRFRPPVGTFTVLFTTVAVMATALNGFDLIELAAPALLAGVLADALASRVPDRVLIGVVPAVLWLGFFAVENLGDPIVWSAELWTGSIVLASVSALLLSSLSAAPVVVREPA